MCPRIRMPGSDALGCAKRARTQSPKPMRPGMTSMRAPMMARSRAATPIILLTAAASKVGLSHTTQVRRPASIVLASNGRSLGFIVAPCHVATVACRNPDRMFRAGARFVGAHHDLIDIETRLANALAELQIPLCGPHCQHAARTQRRAGGSQSLQIVQHVVGIARQPFR